MPLSANTLIHFTNDKEKLKKILEEHFRIFYCKEIVSLVNNKEATYVAPMVSFCDIPLSEVKMHITKYGKYGIGLTKEWAIRKGLNPVLYLSKESKLTSSIFTAMSQFLKGNLASLEIENGKSALVNILRYTKNYEGKLKRDGKEIPDYRYSDEREWRYTPKFDTSYATILYEDSYSTNTQKDIANGTLQELRLDFEPNDIKYIIINSDSEISEFIVHIRDTIGKKYNLHDIERLSTRILTAEQISSDM
jgi:Putative abortive phage resistance protein AbiGi, antitoxin